MVYQRKFALHYHILWCLDTALLIASIVFVNEPQFARLQIGSVFMFTFDVWWAY